MKKRRGIALVVVMSILVLLLIVIVAVTDQSIASLSNVKALTTGERSSFAAEAGVAQVLHQMTLDRAYNTTIPLTPYGTDAAYAVEMVNNFSGAGPKLATNGQTVAGGYCYILATGSRPDGSSPRKVGVMLQGGTGSAIPFALASGGVISLSRGNEKVAGSLKSGGTTSLGGLDLQHVKVTPVNSQGRLLTSGSITTSGGPTTLDSTQDARAQGSIGNKLGGTSQIFPNDTTSDTLPFINDGRYTNNPPAGQQVLPNPDPSPLLYADSAGVPNPAMVVQYPGITSFSSSLDLGGKVHYFPDGITFTSASQITGTGTIVVGNGNPAFFNSGGTLNANIIVIRNAAQQPSGGTPNLTFGSDYNIHGLVYASEGINIQSKFNLTGMMIAYHGGISTGNGPPISFKFDPTVMNLPGFTPWATSVGTPQSGPGPVTVLSWQRF